MTVSLVYLLCSLTTGECTRVKVSDHYRNYAQASCETLKRVLEPSLRVPEGFRGQLECKRNES